MTLFPHTIDITYNADPSKGINRHMTLLGYYNYDAEKEILHMYTPQRMEGHRVAIEECEHLQCRRFKEEKKELPDNLKNLSEKERVLLAIKETADVMVEEFRNQSAIQTQRAATPEEAPFQDGPHVDLESFTRIMSIPSKYGLTPLKIEEYKMREDKDVKQAFSNLEQRMRDAGAPVQDEDEGEGDGDDELGDERVYYMSPNDHREEAKEEQHEANVVVEDTKPKGTESKPTPKITAPPSEPKSEASQEVLKDDSDKRKKSSKKKRRDDDSKEEFPWAAAAVGVVAVAVVAGLAYFFGGGKSTPAKVSPSAPSPTPPSPPTAPK